ncbi:dihydrofolate reductase family protein [Dactylosporangium sucinum]|uniref:Pyrimidine reductase n=1 Tax=Dactylosporangium sucinum TaxID=1424081 RepID=A0A917TTP0_9ACTN|nr:dihydrofolate reductase family protein [Dactylosporangium sucinum]GGM37697.1 pyrimidine reductase [Dactylosporangium sucinum]
MRKIIASTYSTLDGYIDNPHLWSMQYTSEQVQTYALKLLLSSDALLLGRTTFEGMAQAWPNMGGNPYADRVNSIPKYVVSSTLDKAEGWNNSSVIHGDDLATEVAKLKQEPGSNILIWGCGQLTDDLAAHGLLDEYRIWFYPVIKGSGEPLFRPESSVAIEHLDTTTFESGIVVLTYRPTTATAGQE